MKKRPQRIEIEVNPKLYGILKKIHKRGMHGLTIEETAQCLIEEELRRRIHPDDMWIRLTGKSQKG